MAVWGYVDVGCLECSVRESEPQQGEEEAYLRGGGSPEEGVRQAEYPPGGVGSFREEYGKGNASVSHMVLCWNGINGCKLTF